VPPAFAADAISSEWEIDGWKAALRK